MWCDLSLNSSTFDIRLALSLCDILVCAGRFYVRVSLVVYTFNDFSNDNAVCQVVLLYASGFLLGDLSQPCQVMFVMHAALSSAAKTLMVKVVPGRRIAGRAGCRRPVELGYEPTR